MSGGSKGKKKVDVGQTSTTVQEIIGGGALHMNLSGFDPHRAYMARFQEHAGVRSGDGMDRRKKPGFTVPPSAGSALCAKKASEPSPALLTHVQEEFSHTYGNGHAGLQSGDKPDHFTKRGVHPAPSRMDVVIWGRDFHGGKVGDPYVQFHEAHQDFAGSCSREKEGQDRPKKSPLRMATTGVADCFRTSSGGRMACPIKVTHQDLADLKSATAARCSENASLASNGWNHEKAGYAGRSTRLQNAPLGRPMQGPQDGRCLGRTASDPGLTKNTATTFGSSATATSMPPMEAWQPQTSLTPRGMASQQPLTPRGMASQQRCRVSPSSSCTTLISRAKRSA